MLDLAHAVMAACGTELPLTFLPMPTDDPTRRCPDISKARRIFGWQPTVSLEEGLGRLIAAFRQELDRPAHANSLVSVPTPRPNSRAAGNGGRGPCRRRCC